MTHYDTLGVAKTATQDEIKKAYRKLAMDLHPDRHPGDASKEDQLKKVNVAYDVLSDPTKRAAYDRTISGKTQASYAGRGQNWNDIDELVKRWQKTNSKQAVDDEWDRDPYEYYEYESDRYDQEDYRWSDQVVNSDVETELTISLKEAFTGVTSMVTYTLRGQTHTVSVKVPAGIESGTVLKASGAGERRFKSIKAGDLFVKVNVAPDPLYTRNAQNISMDVHVNVIDLMVGGAVTVKTIDDVTIEVQIRAGTQPGTRIRIPQKGMSVRGTSLRGDFYLNVHAIIPENLPDGAVKALKKARNLIK